MELLHWSAGSLLAQGGPDQMIGLPVMLLGLACVAVAVVGAIVLGVVFARTGRSEVVQTCPYCGVHIRGRPVRKCTNCGAVLGPPQQ